MSAKKLKSAEIEIANKMWREKPPGEEQQLLDNLFKTNVITELDSAQNIRSKYPIFQNVSSKVFAVHFRKTRAKFGLMRKNIF